MSAKKSTHFKVVSSYGSWHYCKILKAGAITQPWEQCKFTEEPCLDSKGFYGCTIVTVEFEYIWLRRILFEKETQLLKRPPSSEEVSSR